MENYANLLISTGGAHSASTAPGRNRFAPGRAPKCAPKIYQISINFCVRFLIDFGPFGEAFWRHFSLFFGPRSLLDASWHEKRRFSANTSPANRKSTKMPPGRPPKRAKIDPSRIQKATFLLLNFDLVWGSILAPFWGPLGCLLGSLGASWVPLGCLLAPPGAVLGDQNEKESKERESRRHTSES